MFTKPNHCVGVGINYKNEISKEIINHMTAFDFIEINTEKFFDKKTNDYLEKIIRVAPVVLHGLTLSIGTLEQDISAEYLNKLAITLSQIDCLWFSEHIATTHVNGIEIRALMPVEFTTQAIDKIVKNAKQIMALTKKPFLLENITYYYSMPTSTMSELTFIKKIIQEANCGLLLDLNNLYVNSINHHYDPYEFINQLPLEHIIEVHLAGCDYLYETLIDTHASAISKEVWSLFDYLCKKTTINGVVIERDAKINFLELIHEVQLARDLLNKNRAIKY